MGESVSHKISCGAGFVLATEWHVKAAHSASYGKEVLNNSSPGRGGRNGILNHGILSPLPGLGKFAGD
jgi:hypothetical protein